MLRLRSTNGVDDATSFSRRTPVDIFTAWHHDSGCPPSPSGQLPAPFQPPDELAPHIRRPSHGRSRTALEDYRRALGELPTSGKPWLRRHLMGLIGRP
jgi:hypothetical protein